MGPGTQSGFDPHTPCPARIYDYLLGGKNNFTADREAAERMLAADPGLAGRARRDRAFLAAAVHQAAHAGIRQFIDLGCGFASPSVHGIARDVNPQTRTLCVDTDPQVVCHVRNLLAEPGKTVTATDLADHDGVLGCPEAAILDLAEPAAVAAGLVLHYFAAEDAARIVAGYMRRLAPGSRVMISVPHFPDAEMGEQVRAGFRAGARDHGPGEVTSWLEGLEILPPMVAAGRRWLAGIGGLPAGRDPYLVCAVARKP